MTWTALKYSKSQIEAAGRGLASGEGSPEEIERWLDIVGNWRGAHSFALNSIQIGLRQRASAVCKNVLVAQRLKRVPSINAKLQRFEKMSLSRMQDIGGCRAILESLQQVTALRKNFSRSRQRNVLVGEKDYITSPKASGYRSVHLIYRFESDQSREHSGRLVEIQLRSRLQHSWATAVETVSTFLQRPLKANQGPDEWLKFFALTSSAFAFSEDTPTVPGTSADIQSIREEMGEAFRVLRVEKILSVYRGVLNVATNKQFTTRKSDYFLLLLLPSEEKLTVSGYPKDELDLATEKYLELEKTYSDNPNAQVVLVGADSLKALRRAYPNFYGDTGEFIRDVRRVVSGAEPETSWKKG